MKLKPIIILFINYITTTGREEDPVASGSIEKRSDECISQLDKIYSTSGVCYELRNIACLIMRYIFNEDDDRALVRNELISAIENCLDLCYVTNYKKKLLGSMLGKILNNESLHDFSNDDFSEILIIYYYKYNEIAGYQIGKYKKKFEEMLKTRQDINSLRINIYLIFDDDFRNLVNAMSENLKKLTLVRPSNSDILKALYICNRLIKNPIELEIINYECDLLDLEDVLTELASANIRRFTIYCCSLNSSESNSILKSILNNKTNERLIIIHPNFTESDIKNIIDALKNDEMKLNGIYLYSPEVDESLYLNFLEECKNNKKLEELILEGDQIVSNILEKALDILTGENNLESFILASNQINSENVKGIIQALSLNETLVVFGINSESLKLKDFTLILKSISGNNNSKIEQIIFEGRQDLYNSASNHDKKAFVKAKNILLEKGVGIKYDWETADYEYQRCCCIS